MEDRKPKAASDEFEVAQVVRVYSGCRVNLQSIVVVRRILKETIRWVEDLMRKQEEKLSDHSQLAMKSV